MKHANRQILIDVLKLLRSRAEAMLTLFLIWRLRHVPNRTFYLVLGVIIGGIGGGMAAALKYSVYQLRNMLPLGQQGWFGEYGFLLLPLVGIFITIGLSQKVFKTSTSQGVTMLLRCISRQKSKMPHRKLVSDFLGSLFTVGLGGSTGLEAPSIVTGATVGSSLGRFTHLHAQQRTLLMGCGTAASVAAMFNSPIAGVIFTIEIILSEIKLKLFIPLLLASVTGTVVSQLLVGDSILFSFALIDDFSPSDLPFYTLLGVFTGLVSVFFMRTKRHTERLFAYIKRPYVRGLLAGLALALLLFVFPGVFGEGYNILQGLMTGHRQVVVLDSSLFATIENQWLYVLFLFLLISAKVLATSLTIAGGGAGGVFGPSLVAGGMAGFAFAAAVNQFSGFHLVSESNFALIGMCGLMSGLQFAPLTAIFMIAEITGGYELFIPLMLVSALSYTTTSFFEQHSIFTHALARMGDWLTPNSDLQLLSQITVRQLMEKDVKVLQPDQSFDELKAVVKSTRRSVYPVVNQTHMFLGIITLEDIKDLLFDTQQQQEVSVKKLMHAAPDVITANEPVAESLKKFDQTGAWILPVVDHGVFVGLLAKAKLLNAYRRQLIKQN